MLSNINATSELNETRMGMAQVENTFRAEPRRIGNGVTYFGMNLEKNPTAREKTKKKKKRWRL